MRRIASLSVLFPLVLLGQVGEYDVKAVYLLNFTRFVQWPASAFSGPSAPFTICTLGGDPFGHSLSDVTNGETASGRPLAVRRIDEAPGARQCQILFVAEGDKHVENILKALPPGVLSVGDSESFLRQGGIIQFVVENRRVRFDIHRSTAENAGLRLSSRLFSVARQVVD